MRYVTIPEPVPVKLNRPQCLQCGRPYNDDVDAVLRFDSLLDQLLGDNAHYGKGPRLSRISGKTWDAFDVCRGEDGHLTPGAVAAIEDEHHSLLLAALNAPSMPFAVERMRNADSLFTAIENAPTKDPRVVEPAPAPPTDPAPPAAPAGA